MLVTFYLLATALIYDDPVPNTYESARPFTNALAKVTTPTQ